MGKNINCDGEHCKEENGEVRLLPIINNHSGDMLCCKACYDHEVEFRKEFYPAAPPYPVWDNLEKL